MVLSGGLIGEPGTTWDSVHGSLAGVPVFLGCSDSDAHIPSSRVLGERGRVPPNERQRDAASISGDGPPRDDDEIAVVQEVVDTVLAVAP